MQKTSTRILNTLFMNIPITLALCLFAQMLSVWKGQAESFRWSVFGLNCVVAYISATIIGLGIPSVPLGMAFARKFGAKEGTLPFALLLNLVVNTVYTLFLSIIMTFVNVYLLAGAPLPAVLFGVLENFIPIWIVCYIISLISAPVCQNLAIRLTES
ncbi:MAG: hypothetical protein HFH35_08830 [Eubacterium sp.]|nr:hypothetical protein [Eubacterium sp.]